MLACATSKARGPRINEVTVSFKTHTACLALKSTVACIASEEGFFFYFKTHYIHGSHEQ